MTTLTIDSRFEGPPESGNGRYVGRLVATTVQVGRALCAALEARARALGLPGLVLDASLNSVTFYEAVGFRRKGVERHDIAAGLDFECVVMEKVFPPDALRRAPQR